MPVMTQPTNEIVPARGPLDLTKPLDARDPVLDATAAQLAPLRRPTPLEPGAGGATDSQAMSMKRIADALETLCGYAAVIAHPMLIAEPLRAIPEEKRPRGRPPK